MAMGQQARKHARRDFCASKIVKRYEEIYRQTIDSAGPAAEIF
jgi:hypothetical protein